MSNQKQSLEDVRRDIDLIVKAMTSESPLSFTFIHWKIEEKKASKLPGLIAGAAIGGLVGEMIFGGTLISSSSCSYSGELGILILTQTKIIIGHFEAPFPSADGKIIPEHLALFRKRLDSNAVDRKEFPIFRAQLSRSTASGSIVNLVCGAEEISFKKSYLHVNNAVYGLPSTADIYSQIMQMGTLITPSECIAKLQRGENALSKDQFAEIENDDAYMTKLFWAIVKHRDRDVLVRNFRCQDLSVRNELEALIKSSFGKVLRKSIKYGVLTVAGSVGAIVGIHDEGYGFVFFVCLVFTLITITLGIRSVRDAKWVLRCRSFFSSESINP